MRLPTCLPAGRIHGLNKRERSPKKHRVVKIGILVPFTADPLLRAVGGFGQTPNWWLAPESLFTSEFIGDCLRVDILPALTSRSVNRGECRF